MTAPLFVGMPGNEAMTKSAGAQLLGGDIGSIGTARVSRWRDILRFLTDVAGKRTRNRMHA